MLVNCPKAALESLRGTLKMNDGETVVVVQKIIIAISFKKSGKQKLLVNYWSSLVVQPTGIILHSK